MSRRVLVAALTASLLAMVAALALRHSTSTARAGATINPNDFATKITNPWLPYKAGSVWVYRGIKDGQTQRDVVKATHRTKMILGVTCTAVSDIATHNGRVLERTTDWYAQDKQGNV